MRGSAQTHTHTGRGAGQTDGSDRLMNRKSANDKKERKHWPCVRDMCACVCAYVSRETFCLSSLLRTRPHSLAPVLLCLFSTGVCGWLDKLCWFWSTQQCCSRRSHTEFRFTSDTRISVIPNAVFKSLSAQCNAYYQEVAEEEERRRKEEGGDEGVLIPR